MKVAVYLFISFTVILSCVEAHFKKDVMRSLLSPRQSTSDCGDIVPEMCPKDIVDDTNIFGLNFTTLCGDCNDEYIRFFECLNLTTAVEVTRGAFCAVNDDGEYCGVRVGDDMASGLLDPESCENCVDECDYYEYASRLEGCCAASFARYDLLDVGDCDTDLGEPCSGSSQFATPMFLGIITLAVITVLTLF